MERQTFRVRKRETISPAPNGAHRFARYTRHLLQPRDTEFHLQQSKNIAWSRESSYSMISLYQLPAYNYPCARSVLRKILGILILYVRPLPHPTTALACFVYAMLFVVCCFVVSAKLTTQTPHPSPPKTKTNNITIQNGRVPSDGDALNASPGVETATMPAPRAEGLQVPGGERHLRRS